MSLHVLADNFERVIGIPGFAKTMRAINPLDYCDPIGRFCWPIGCGRQRSLLGTPDRKPELG